MSQSHSIANDAHGHHGSHHSPIYYVKIWALLLVLLVISIVGPMLEIKIVTLVTAFGVALVKAGIVASYFMHLNVEKRYIWYMLYSMLLIVGLMFVGVAADVMKPRGQRWENKAALDLIEEHSKLHGGSSDNHGAPHH